MRERFHEELRRLDGQVCELAALARDAMSEATEALIAADRSRAEWVLSNDIRLDALRSDIQEDAVSLLALQAPVASELRRIYSALLIATELERMGDLAVHVADITRRRCPVPVATDELSRDFRSMGSRALQLAEHMCQVLESDDVELARTLEREDDALDALKRSTQKDLLYAPELPGVSLSENVQHAVDGILLARYFERFGDHAVAVGRRVVFRSVGGSPAGTDPEYCAS